MNKEDISYIPIILIGAARSGTKLLRDVISTSLDVEKIPFDINFVWKYNNEKIPHDLLTQDNYNSKAEKFIKKYFNKFSKKKPFLIEKTVSNTLRIDFVRRFFPNAKFIYLIRDGRDVVESVARQWGTAPKGNYLIDKLKTFPLSKTLSYGWLYGTDLVKIKLLGQPSESYVWGVKYPNYKVDLKNDDVHSFCSKQWKFCIEESEKQIKNIPTNNLMKIRYEDFVKDPLSEFLRIENFLGLNSKINREEIKKIKPNNVGKGFKKLTEEQRKKVLKIIAPTLTKLNYKV